MRGISNLRVLLRGIALATTSLALATSAVAAAAEPLAAAADPLAAAACAATQGAGKLGGVHER